MSRHFNTLPEKVNSVHFLGGGLDFLVSVKYVFVSRHLSHSEFGIMTLASPLRGTGENMVIALRKVIIPIIPMGSGLRARNLVWWVNRNWVWVRLTVPGRPGRWELWFYFCIQ